MVRYSATKINSKTEGIFIPFAMSAQFHTPTFHDVFFDIGDAPTSTPTSALIAGNNNPAFSYQQQTPPSVRLKCSN